MGKIAYGILGAFSGQVGPVIGYLWRGRMCMRSRPMHVANPRTEAQQAHRMAFREMVQLSARMKEAIRVGLRSASMAEGMTEQNLFVRLNFKALGAEGLAYRQLRISMGQVAPVEVTAAEVDAEGVARVEWGRSQSQLVAMGDDEVMLYAYCPSAGYGLLSAAVQRRRKRAAMMLPEEWRDREVHLYCFVRNHRGECSNSMYVEMASPLAGEELVSDDRVAAQPQSQGVAVLPSGERQSLDAAQPLCRAPGYSSVS